MIGEVSALTKTGSGVSLGQTANPVIRPLSTDNDVPTISKLERLLAALRENRITARVFQGMSDRIYLPE